MSVLFYRLALGGGGAKGILHIGALQELSKFQPLYFQNGIYGSSIGSIIATYVAFGLPIDNMVPLLKKYLVYRMCFLLLMLVMNILQLKKLIN